jgi:predicted permease
MFLSFLYRCRAALRNVARRAHHDDAMREEMAEHLARATERHVARGLSPSDARDAARREFGNVAVLQEEGRDARGARWIESLIADLRFAVRQLRRRPLASATIVGVLMLGIGVHAAIFTMIEASTLRPAPGVEPRASLVRILAKELPPEGGAWMPRLMSYPEFMDVAQRSDLFSRTAAWSSDNVTIELGDEGSPTSARAEFITGDYFTTLGVRVAVGTTLPLPDRADGSDGEMAAVISDAMWQDFFGGAADVIGKTLRVNDARVKIVGVGPRRFIGATPSGQEHTMWMPLASRATVLRTSRTSLLSRDSTLVSGIALLAPDISASRASAAVGVIADRAIARMAPAPDHTTRTTDIVALRASNELPGNPDLMLNMLILVTSGLLVLLVACTNVSALVVGAGMARRHEIAIRLSLGASRARLVRQLVTESCVLAVLGGAAGLMLYAAIVHLLERQLPEIEIAPDLATVGFTLLFAIGTGILFGLSPALHATRSGVGEALKTGKSLGAAGGGGKLQSFFVVAQIAVTQPLLVGLAVMLAMVVQMSNKPAADPAMAKVLRLRFYLNDEPPARHARLRAAIRELEQLPGVVRTVRDAAGHQDLAFDVAPESRANLLRQEPANVSIEGVDPGYFGVLDVKILRGRDVELADSAARDMPVVIGSDYARELWGTADPIGRRFQQITHGEALPREAVVVGVFDAARGTTRGEARRVYTVDPADWRDFAFLVQTSAPAADLVPQIRSHLRERLPDIAIPYMQTLAQKMADDRRNVLAAGTVAGAAGALVLLLASIGLYGVIALAVTQRRREIGVRVALGAKPWKVVALLFANGLRLAAIGLAIGLPLSILTLRFVGGQMSAAFDAQALGISPPAIGVLIALAVLGVASFATWLPARRAARVDPMIALRSE